MKQFLSFVLAVSTFAALGLLSSLTHAQQAQSTQNDSQSSAQLLRRANQALLKSPSFQSSVHITNRLFDQVIEAGGFYLHKGQGTGKSRMQLRFGDAENPIEVTQICDGRLNYVLTAGGEKRTLEFVDLLQISEKDSKNRLATPVAWMTTGGLTSLLEHAAKSFDFQPIHEYTAGEDTVIQVRGTWKKQALKKFFGDSVNHTWIDNPLKWHRLPGQLPHVIEFHLKPAQGLALFPSKINFLQLQEKEGNTKMVPVISIELSDIQVANNLADEYFQVNNENVTPIDTTDNFLGRVEEQYSKRRDRTASESGNERRR